MTSAPFAPGSRTLIAQPKGTPEMDMHTSNLRLPGEVAPGPAAPPLASTATPVSPPSAPAVAPKTGFRLDRRNIFFGCTALVAVGIGAMCWSWWHQPGPEDFGLQMDLPAAAVAPPPTPTLEATVAPAPKPQVTLAAPVLPAAQPPEPVAPPVPAAQLPAPTVPLPAATPRAEPDPLAEQRQLLQQATAPLAPAAAPPAPNEEVGKLSAMVTSLGAMLGESLKGQIALRKEVAQLQADLRAAQADANSRIAFLEAKVTVSAAQNMAAGSSSMSAPATSQAAPQRPTPAPAAPAPRSANAATTYRITGAASNLAYLVAVNPAPNQPPAVEAKVGSEVPGYGRVLSIGQKGTSWEVVTERGTITN